MREPPGATRYRIGEISIRYAKRLSALSLPYGFRDKGLSERIADATAAAAFAAGNDLYEHQTQEAGDTNSLRRSEAKLILAGASL